MATGTVPRARTNPYPGPRNFQRGERLYGRDRETAELNDLVVAQRIVLLYSPSGAGKSSLVQAALCPALEQDGFEVLPIVRLGTPAAEGESSSNRYVSAALSSLEEGRPETERADIQGSDLKGYLNQRWPLDKSDGQVLVFDQFEEVFTADPTDVDVKKDFFQQVGSLLRDRRRWAIFVMREDHRSRVDPYLRYLPTRLRATYRLELLGVDAAVDAIRKPALEAGVDFQQEAARLLVDDLRRVVVQRADGSTTEALGPHVEPVQLQVACRTLWDNLSDDVTQVCEDSVRELGDVDSALRSFYDHSVTRVCQVTDVPEREVRDWFQEELITPGGLRDQALLGEETTQGLRNDAVLAAVDTHVVRAERRLGATWFELSHDRLVEPVRASNADWRDIHLTTIQRRATEWNRDGRSDSQLLTGDVLSEALAETDRDSLTRLESDFLGRCEAEDEELRRERRKDLIVRWSLAGVTVLSLGIAIVSMVMFHAAREAKFRGQRLMAQRLAGAAMSDVRSKPQRSLLLATHAHRIAEELEGKGTGGSGLTELATARVLDQLNSLVGGQIFASGTGVGPVVAGPQGRWLVRAQDDGSIRLWDLRDVDAAPRVLLEPTHSITTLSFSGDGNWLAAGGNDRWVWAWDLEQLDQKPHECDSGPGEALAVTIGPDIDGHRLMATAGAEFRIHDLTSGQTETWPVSKDQQDTNVIAISPDGQYLASGHADGLTSLRRLDGGGAVERSADLAGAVTLLAFTPDSEFLTLAGSNPVFGVMRTGRPESEGEQSSGRRNELTISGRNWGSVLALDTNQKGRLAVGSADATVRLYNLPMIMGGWVDASQWRVETLPHDDDILSLGWNRSGERLVVGATGSLVAWDLHLAGYNGTQYFGHEGGVGAVSFREPDELPVSAGDDGTFRLWDPEGARLTFNLLGHELDQRHRLIGAGHALTSDGVRPVIAAADFIVQRVSTEGQPAADESTGNLYRRQDSGELTAMATHAGSPLVIHGTAGGAVRAWNVNEPATSETELSASGSHCSSLALSPNGGQVAVGRRDGSVSLIATDGSSVRELLAGSDRGVSSLAFNDSGTSLAAGHLDGAIHFWTSLESQAVTKLRRDGDAVHALAFLAEQRTDAGSVAWGARLLSGGYDGVLTVWDVDEGSALSSVRLHDGAILDLAVSPDGRWFASSGGDSLIKVGEPALFEIPAFAIRRSQTPVRSLSWNPEDGSLVATTAAERIWRWRLGWSATHEPGAKPEEIACLHAGRALVPWERARYLGRLHLDCACPQYCVTEDEAP